MYYILYRSKNDARKNCILYDKEGVPFSNKYINEFVNRKILPFIMNVEVNPNGSINITNIASQFSKGHFLKVEIVENSEITTNLIFAPPHTSYLGQLFTCDETKFVLEMLSQVKYDDITSASRFSKSNNYQNLFIASKLPLKDLKNKELENSSLNVWERRKYSNIIAKNDFDDRLIECSFDSLLKKRLLYFNKNIKEISLHELENNYLYLNKMLYLVDSIPFWKEKLNLTYRSFCKQNDHKNLEAFINYLDNKKQIPIDDPVHLLLRRDYNSTPKLLLLDLGYTHTDNDDDKIRVEVVGKTYEEVIVDKQYRNDKGIEFNKNVNKNVYGNEHVQNIIKILINKIEVD